MKNLIRVLMLGLFAGTLFGWWLAHQQQRREEEARREAYVNDPERLSIKKERARIMQVDKWLEEFEDGDA